MKKTIKSYIIGMLIPIGVGLLAAFLTRGNMDIYQNLSKPSLVPPGIVFPIVWTVLYTLMGISSVRIYQKGRFDMVSRNKALYIYGLQLIVNFVWTLVFFNKGAYLLSFILIVVLWILILAMILKFKEIDKAAAILQIPYLLWVTFAGYLSLMIYLLNR